MSGTRGRSRGIDGQRTGTAHRAGRGRLGPVAALLLVLVVLAVGVSGASAGAQSGQGDGSVEVHLTAGSDGVVGDATTLPVTVTLDSPRARQVDVTVEVDGRTRVYRVELVAGAPVELDVAAARPVGVTSFRVTAVVRDLDERRLGESETEVVPDAGSTLVGVGASLGGADAEARLTTVAGIQTAHLVPLDATQWSRPGVLPSLSGIVLGAGDLDDLTDDHRAALRTWVWQGGNLALDVPRADELPVVDLPAAPGARTAVGAGWVRFTEGRAASGPWSAVLEPAVASVAQPEMFEVWGNDEEFRWLGLIDIDFLPVTVVIAAVFGTALLAGPALWLLFRNRSGRRWMWLVSPAVSVAIAGALLVVGQGVFTTAEARAVGSVSVTPWATTGQVVFGLRESGEFRLGPDVDVVASSPDAVVTDLGDGRSASVDLPRNGFGYFGLGPVALDDGPMIEVTAVATGDDRADVTVTNRSDQPLRAVSVRTAGRVRPFEDVPAGESVTLPFVVSAEVAALGDMFPIDQASGFNGFGGGFSSFTTPPLPMTRGLVVVTGVTDGAVAVAGLSARGQVEFTAVAPVTSETEDQAALRIETVGVAPTSPEEQFEDPVFEDPGPDFGETATTTMVFPPPDGQQEPGGGELAEQAAYVRLSAAAGRAAAPCGIHTAIGEVSVWDGARWAPGTRVGEPYLSDRLTGANEVQDWALPAIEPGAALYVRLDSRLTLRPPLLFDCGGAR